MSATPSPRWFLERPSDDAEARLFAFPYSGCGASMYHRWPRRVGGVEITPLQLPGRENRLREPHYGTYEQLADELVDVLAPYVDRPYGFFGHCGGALPGVECAIRLGEAGLRQPDCLFLSSQVAPHEGPFGRFLSLGDDELREELRKLVVSLGGTPLDSMLELGLDVLRRDLDANRRYRLDEPVRLPSSILVIAWTRDREIPRDRMPGWDGYSADVRHVLLDGEHHAFLHAPEPLLELFAPELAGAFAAAQAGAGPA